MAWRAAAIFVLLALTAPPAEASAATVDFNRDVRPILAENCFHCHGADGAKRQAELRLDDRDAAVEYGAIVPGDAEASLLVERIVTDDPEVKMPPPESKRSLTAEQIDVLTRWVREGAPYSPHWAFQAPTRPATPGVANAAWTQNDIDRFVLARLEQEKLKPSPRAPQTTLLRRIALDVIGLPPTPAQLAAWTASADPVQSALNELLASPHYGERMATDWLDVARYADTHGFNNDSARTMWRWRDWVIDAFNANLPYDDFLTEQLAGDLMESSTLEQQIATGFNRNHVINSEGGIIDEEYRVEYVADRVRTTSLAWLGLTLECARCHDHKYDPLLQRDYYSIFAFFNNIDETGEDGRVANASPLTRAPTREQVRRLDELVAKEGELRGQLDELAERSGIEALAAQRQPPASPDASLWAPLEKRLVMREAEDGLRLPGAKPLAADVASTDLSQGWALCGWVKPDAVATAALASSMDFSAPPSSGGYGSGWQVRLTAIGAVEVRMAVRWPGYSVAVASLDALPAGEWSHLAVVGHGTKAEGLRIFIDGEEVETRLVHDDLTGGVTVSGPVQIGASGDSADPHFAGELRRLRVVSGPLDEALLSQLLESEVPHQAPTTPEYLALLDQWRAARRERLAFERSFPSVMVMDELTELRPTFVLERGQYDRPTDRVEPDVPAALGLALPAGPRNRLTLAAWLTDPRHPLTARVVVNRLWQSYFGVGLVKTVEDFGTRSDWPSHPELLDWLALELIESGWDVQHMIRLIVGSATYQQDSAAAPEQWAADPENRLLARGPRRRLSAEMIRDQALAASGLLAPRVGGPPVYPLQPPDLYQGIIVAAAYPGTTWELSPGDDSHRRSLYTFWKRTIPHPTLSTFDAPDREFCTARRTATNTPLQALVLMNDPIFLEAARALAGRMLTEGGATDAARLGWGFEMLTTREPTAHELERLVQYVAATRSEFTASRAPKGLLDEIGGAGTEAAPASVDAATYASAASLLLNLDEVINRN